MRVVSLLPSATDIVVALGAADDLVGVSHSCSGEWDHLPKLTSTWIDTSASAAAIDEQVTSASRPLYQLDIAALERLQPDVIISQSLCDVCAVPSGDVDAAVRQLSSQPVVLDLAPDRLGDLPQCFELVGRAIGRPEAARRLVARWHTELSRHHQRFADSELRVAFLDWLDPPFAAGHWIPDMLEWLGVTCALAQPGEASFRVTWEQIDASQPDLVIAACCGLDQRRAEIDAARLKRPIICLDGDALFSRPSQALLSSMALLAETIAAHR
ncbi:MAG: ABC transporter substrate-binding protein [Pseudomonadota bacterium]